MERRPSPAAAAVTLALAAQSLFSAYHAKDAKASAWRGRRPSPQKAASLRFPACTVATVKYPHSVGLDAEVNPVYVRVSPIKKPPDGDGRA